MRLRITALHITFHFKNILFGELEIWYYYYVFKRITIDRLILEYPNGSNRLKQKGISDNSYWFPYY